MLMENAYMDISMLPENSIYGRSRAENRGLRNFPVILPPQAIPITIFSPDFSPHIKFCGKRHGSSTKKKPTPLILSSGIS